MPKATTDGVVEIDGPENPFFVRAGDDYPEGGTFRLQDPPPPQELSAPSADAEEETTERRRR